MKKIALEEHFITAELSQYSMSQHSVQSMFAAGRHSAAKVQQRFAEQLVEFDGMRLEAMDKAGIELSVLSVTTPGVQAEKDARTAVRLARAANDFLARQIERHPTRYAGFAHLPLQDPNAAADELARCVGELGFKGAMINGHTNGHYLDEESCFPFWERAQELDVPIYLHPRDPSDTPQMYRDHPELLGPTWSWTVETGTHALRLVFGGIFDRFPNVTVILGHMGETLPFLLWRLDSRWRFQSADKSAAKPPSEVIRRNIVITTTGVCSHPSLLCALSALGEDSVMFSVDYPYEDSSIAADFIDTAPISETVRAKVCHGNAERLLRL